MNMKLSAWLLAGAALAAGLGLSGCTDPISPRPDELAAYPQIQLQGYWTQTWTRFQPPVVQRVANGQLQVSLEVRNLTDDDIPLDYSYRFFRGGVQCEEPSGWMNIRVPRKNQATIQFTSLTPADNYQVSLRYAK